MCSEPPVAPKTPVKAPPPKPVPLKKDGKVM